MRLNQLSQDFFIIRFYPSGAFSLSSFSGPSLVSLLAQFHICNEESARKIQDPFV